MRAPHRNCCGTPGEGSSALTRCCSKKGRLLIRCLSWPAAWRDWCRRHRRVHASSSNTLGETVPEDIEIPFPVSRQDLADLIGSTLPTVSRTLGTWEAQRQIRRYRCRLVIADTGAVEAVLTIGLEADARPRRSHRRAARA